MKTLVSLIPDTEHIVTTEKAMRKAGMGDCKISILARPAEVWECLESHIKMREVLKYILYGALAGLVVATLYGLPASIMNCIHLGCPFSENLGLLVAICLFWIVAGTFVGALIGLDRLEQDMYPYIKGVHQGGSLMIIITPDKEAAEVAEILEHEGGLLVHSIESEQEGNGG